MDYKVRTKIRQIVVEEKVPVDTKVTILGLVRSARKQKKVAFVVINDGSCPQPIQGVISEPDKFPDLEHILTGAAIRMRGTLRESPARGQKFEVEVEELNLIGAADESYPLQRKHHSMEFLREIAHLRPRTNTFGAVNRVRSRLAYAIHKYYQDRGFHYIHTPIITGSDCEGAGDLFKVTTLPIGDPPRTDGDIAWDEDFFSRQTYLTVSGQLEGELVATALGDIYTFGPTFRAENSNTARHASEFWMIEPEMAWAELEDDMDLAEDFLKHLFSFALEDCADDMVFFNDRIHQLAKRGEVEQDYELIEILQSVVNAEFERVSYTEAVELLGKSGRKFEYPANWGADLQTEHERYLTEQVFKKPVIVYDYPLDIKAFYMRVNDDWKTVRAMDVLVPRVGEIIGGSQREERLDVLKKHMEKKGLTEWENYDWYFDIRKYGTLPHAGFGLGFERAIMYITGMQNIRDVLPFPRVPRWAKF